MSSLHKRAPFPASMSRSVASSNREYSKVKSSFAMSSLIDEPCGWDKSIISLTVPSFFGAAPIGEQWVCGNGGLGKGPTV